MSNKYDDILDLAIIRQQKREPLAVILADHPDQAAEIGRLLEIAAVLSDLPVEIASDEAMAADRAAFFVRMGQLPAPTVSNDRPNRLKEWMAQRLPRNLPVIRLRERNRMSAFILKTALVLMMIAGSAGGTVVLASESLPGTPLYSVKLIVEDTQLALADDLEQEANLQLAFVAERVREMQRMALSGDQPDEANLERLQQHLSQAFHLAAGTPDETMKGLLVRMLVTVQRQEKILEEAQAAAGDRFQATLRETDGLMARARAEAEYGLQSSAAFRGRHQQSGQGSEDWGKFGPGSVGCPDPANCGTGGGSYGPGPESCLDPASCGNGEGGNGSLDCVQAGSCQQYQEQNREQNEPGSCAEPGICQQNQVQNREQNGSSECVDPATCQQNQERIQGQSGPGDCAGPGACQQNQAQNQEQNSSGECIDPTNCLQNQERNQGQNGTGDCAEPGACQQTQGQNQEQNGSGDCGDPAACQQIQERNREQSGSRDPGGAEPSGDNAGPAPADDIDPGGSSVNDASDGSDAGTGGDSDSGSGSGGSDSGGGVGGGGGH